jgi:hypothetical protein
MHKRTDASLREMNTETRANNEKFEILQDTLASQMDIHQAMTEYTQEEMKANQEKIEATMEACLEKMEATGLKAILKK